MDEKLNKVAKITVFFWIMKILATTLGETLGDQLSMTLNIGYLVSLVITFSFFILVLFTQIKSKKFHPALYWIVIIATTTAGTEISDFMDRTLGLGYALGALLLFSSLVLVLFIWYKREGKIEVYPVFKPRVEILYWIAILFSNSLGTAFGDFLSDNLGLTYLQGALATSGVIAIVLLIHYFTKINQIILFWIAFIFTRPFGATFGDFLTKPISKGGLFLGTLNTSLITVSLIIIVLFFSTRNEKLKKWTIN